MQGKTDRDNVFPPEMDPTEIEVPAGVDRRGFLMRSAVVGAAAVITGCSPAGPRQQPARPPAAPPAPEANLSPDLDVVKKSKGPVMTDDRRVLQGRPRPVEFAHHRADADHLRLLPALHEAAGRPAREGHRPEGAPVRQPQRHRQGPRHRARRPGRHHRQGAGDRRPAVPRRAGRQAGPDLPGQARRQDVQRLAQGHRLRRAEGRLPAPQHHDLQADGRRRRAARAGVLLGRRRLHRVEGLRSRRRRARRSTRTRR